MSNFFHQNYGQSVTTATCRTSTPQLFKRRQSHKPKLTFERNELMYNFLLVLRALIVNRFCYICHWSVIGKAGNWGARGGGGAGGQETLPVGSGGAENVLPTVSWSSAGNGESWILRGVSAGICASGKRKQELIRACSRLSDSGEWHFPLSKRLKQDRSWWENKMIEL